ncbi:diguanylate cyclase [Pseudenhygromyxa sp. WMMC2535]|uniref:diguanylate cyclase n=1 Tax=Pseudenhygromyxa sp. WMMC2535 TaxID=2712867 RepID=UPI001595ECA9|nr:diguanylate cyclase [Pseudenhygromyxa sp. WMMC2535]
MAEAVDGQQALEVFARERPDLVLLDVVMPRLTGLETCRILKAKAQGNYLPVIMVSTRNSVNARVEGCEAAPTTTWASPTTPKSCAPGSRRCCARARSSPSGRRPRAATRSRPKRSPWPRRPALARAAATESPRARGCSTRPFTRRAEEEFDRAERYSDPLACLRVELDNFETLLKRHSSEAVAGLVRSLRDVIEISVRKIDLVFRLDERGYILLLPNTHFPGALAVAERISLDTSKLVLDAEPNLRCTVSVGVSFFPNKDTHSVQDLIDLVGAALERRAARAAARSACSSIRATSTPPRRAELGSPRALGSRIKVVSCCSPCTPSRRRGESCSIRARMAPPRSRPRVRRRRGWSSAGSGSRCRPTSTSSATTPGSSSPTRSCPSISRPCPRTSISPWPSAATGPCSGRAAGSPTSTSRCSGSTSATSASCRPTAASRSSRPWPTRSPAG